MNSDSDGFQSSGGKSDLVLDVCNKTKDGSGTNSLYGLDFLSLGFRDKGGPSHPSVNQDR